jgi:hypothetical protein
VTSQQGCIDTADCFIVDQVELSDLQDNLSIEVYPNPAKDYLNISFQAVESISLTILNAQGQVVQLFEKVISGEKLQLNNFAKGMYVIQINSSYGTKIERLIIE